MFKRYFFLLLALFIGLRVIYMYTQSRDWVHAGWEHDSLSDNYLATGTMQMSYFGGPLFPSAGEAPGVAFVLIGLKKYFKDHYFLAMSVVHLVVATCTFWLFVHFAFQLLPEKAATWAAALFIVDINLFSVTRWVNETLYTEFFFVLCVYAFWLMWRSPSTRHALLLGISLGFAALFRPTFLLVCALMLGVLFVEHIRSKTVTLKSIALVLVCVGVVLAPWAYRNYRTFHKFIPVAQYLGINLWNGWAPDSGGSMYRLNGDPVVMEPWLLEKAKAATSETELDQLLISAAIGYAKENPLRWVKQRFYAFAFFWHEHTFWAPNSPFRTKKAQVLAIYNLILLFAFVMSIGPAWKAGPFMRMMLGLMFVHSMIYTFIHADIGNRYRLQIEPLLLLVLGVGCEYWASRFRKSDSPVPT
jgi:hypothetical protein